MNVAFVLMTTAWLAQGQVPPPPAAPPVAPAACGATCGGCSDPCGCESFGHRLRGHLRGLFARDCCDTCNTCAPAPRCCTPAPVCCTPKVECCHEGFRWHRLFHRNDCCQPTCCPAPAPVCCAPVKVCCPAPAPVCCTPVKTCCPAPTCCDSCGGPRFLDRLRAWRHSCDSCGSTCGSCSSCGGSTAPAAPAEPIPAPGSKKLPVAGYNYQGGPIPQSNTAITETTVIPATPAFGKND